jgi:hypothetical protein
VEQLGSHWTDFHENLIFEWFLNFVEKIKIVLESEKKLTHYVNAVRLRQTFKTKVVKKKKLFNNFSPEDRAVF